MTGNVVFAVDKRCVGTFTRLLWYVLESVLVLNIEMRVSVASNLVSALCFSFQSLSVSHVLLCTRLSFLSLILSNFSL